MNKNDVCTMEQGKLSHTKEGNRMAKTTFSKRMMSIFLCVALMLTYMPLAAAAAEANPLSDTQAIADEGTASNWEKMMGTAIDGNRYAGRVWVDKSVYTDGQTAKLNSKNEPGSSFEVTLEDDEAFQVIFSALGSSMSTTETTSASGPMDVVLVLDNSDSMQNSSRMQETIDAANKLLVSLLENNNIRVGITAYEEYAATVLPFGTYNNGIELRFDRSGVITAYDRNGNVIDNRYKSNGYELNTNIQAGFELGMEMLANATDTTGRKPVAILLTDGAANTAVDTLFGGNAKGEVHQIYYSNNIDPAIVLSTLLSTAYNKAVVAKHYGVAPMVYGIGVDLSNSDGSNAIINPRDNFNSANNNRNVRSAYSTYVNTWATGNNVEIETGSGRNTVDWFFGHTYPTDSGITDGDINKNINYVDTYYSVSGAELESVFDQIYEELSSVAFNPISSSVTTDGATGVEDTPLIFVDFIGQHMEIKEIEAVTLFGSSYGVINNGGGTYSVASATGINPTTDENWKTDEDIKIAVTEQADGTQKLEIRIYQEILPIIMEQVASKTVGEETTSTITEFVYDPLRVYYTVGLDDEILLPDGDIDIRKIKEYPHIDQMNGTATFYSNQFGVMNKAVNGVVMAGDAHVGFRPSAENCYYYHQSNQGVFTAIHKKSDGSEVTISPNDEYGIVWNDSDYELSWMTYDEYLTAEVTDQVYTYVSYYHPTPSVTDAVNAAEKVTYLVYMDWEYLKESVAFYDAITGKYVNYNDGTYTLDDVGVAMTAEQIAAYAHRNPSADLYAVLGVGSMRTSRLHNMEIHKTPNRTETAQLSYDPVFLHNVAEHETHNDNDVVVWLGNNGKLTVPINTGIALTKSVTEAIGHTNDTYALTVTLPSGVKAKPVVTDAHGNDVTDDIADYDNYVLTVNLKAGETVYVSGIPATTECIIGEIIPAGAGYSIYSKTDTVTIPTLAQVLDNHAEQFVPAIVTNTPNKFGDLTIVKDVLHHLEQTPEAMSDKAFTFKLQLPPALAGEYDVDKTNATLFTEDQVVVGTDGTFTVKLKDNESITIKRIPAGTVYTVTEEGSVPGYANTTGTVSGAIEADTDAVAHFINTYTTTPIKPSVTINGTKTVTSVGAAYAADEEFAFVLSQYVGVSNEHPTGYIELGTTNAKDGENYSFDLAALLTTELDLGEHHFRITERTGSTAGMIYDATRGLFSVRVTDVNADGVLEYTIRNYANTTINGNVVTKDFTNIYDVDHTYVDVNISKLLTNNTGVDMPKDVFDFELVNTTDPSEKYQATTDASGKATIRIPDLDVGEYQYRLAEVDEGIPGMVYDSRVYVINIAVTNSGETLAALAEIEGSTQANGDNSIDIEFENTYVLTPAKHTISGSKVLEGRTPLNKEFSFALYETESSFIIRGDPIDIAENAGFSFAFDDISYSRVGTYYYSVKELRGSRAGVTYDATHYHVTVTVGVDDNDASRLAVTGVSINKIGSNSDTSGDIVFVNRYKTTSTAYQLSGHKKLSGRAMKADEFTFALYEGDVEIGRATNKADGSFLFKEIYYDEAGVFNYTVKELEPSVKAPGVTYSGANAPVMVTVTVTDENAHLSVSGVVVRDMNGQELPRGIVFENTYAAKPAMVTFNGEKTFDGGNLAEQKFTFDLYQTDHNFVIDGVALASRQNDNDGKFSFTQEFGKTGMYFFAIVEDASDSLDEIVYDRTVHCYAVRVSDSGDGQLRAAVMNVDNGNVSALADVVSVDVTFTNATFDETVEKEVYLAGNSVARIDGQKIEQGSVLTYFITYKNYTGEDVEVDILDAIPQHTTYVDGSASHDGNYAADHINWILTVARGESVTVSFDVKVNDAEAIVSNTAIIRDGVNTYTTNEVVNHTVDEPLKKDVYLSSDLSVNIDGEKVYAGDELIYKIHFTNVTDKAVNVTISDDIPKGTTYVIGSADNGGVYKNGTITWTFENVPAWTTVTVAFKVKVNDNVAAVSIQNTATATDGENNYTTKTVSNEFSEKSDDHTPSTPADPRPDDSQSIPVSPQTGDTANLHLWFALLFVSGSGIVVTSLMGKKRKEPEEA